MTPAASLATNTTGPLHDALNVILCESHGKKQKDLKELQSKYAQLLTQVERPRVALSFKRSMTIHLRTWKI
jgi:hypothetical protein